MKKIMHWNFFLSFFFFDETATYYEHMPQRAYSSRTEKHDLGFITAKDDKFGLNGGPQIG